MESGIWVNGDPFVVITEHVTYEQIVEWSGRKGNPSVVFVLGPEENREGILYPGKSVKVKGGMKFDVGYTGAA